MSDYEQTARLYVVSHLGGVKLSKLGPEHLQRLYSQLQRHRAALKAHRLLHRVLALALMWGWAADNSANRAIAPSYRPET